MKRLTSLLLALVMVCSLCACGGKGKEPDTSEGAEQTVEETAKIVVKDDATKEDNTDKIGQNSKDIVESMSESNTDYLNECATFAQFVERNRDSYTTKPFEFQESDYTDSDYQPVRLNSSDYLGITDMVMVDEKDFRIQFNGVNYKNTDTTGYIEVDFSIYNKCPLDIDIHGYLVVNGFTQGYLMGRVKSGEFQDLGLLVNESVLSKSGSNKISSLRFGEIQIDYNVDEDDNNIKDEYRQAKGYIVPASNITLGEVEKHNDVEKIDGLLELYSDEAIDVWYVPSTSIGEKDSYYEVGLLLLVNNKLKEREISLNLKNIDGYDHAWGGINVEPNSYTYGFIGLCDKDGEKSIELRGEHSATFDFELANMDGIGWYRHNLELNLDNMIHWE